MLLWSKTWMTDEGNRSLHYNTCWSLHLSEQCESIRVHISEMQLSRQKVGLWHFWNDTDTHTNTYTPLGPPQHLTVDDYVRTCQRQSGESEKCSKWVSACGKIEKNGSINVCVAVWAKRRMWKMTNVWICVRKES